MTRWVVIFDDTPGMLVHRREFGAAHIDYLERHSDRILVGGGLRPVPDAPFVGGMWIVEAGTYDEVVDLVLNDPYFIPDHRRFRILAWGKAIDREVVL
ncbi:MAG: YciI family protein [Albidovulum sp.]|uniref:YciI family protein n=1 Tax=Albidovulum sp. TaxID=1872424 RepID=UPI003CB99C49